MRKERTRSAHYRDSRSSYALGLLNGAGWRKRHAKSAVNFEAAASAIQRYWSGQVRRMAERRPGWWTLLRHGRRYAAGFLRGARVKGRFLPIPLHGTAAAVVYAPRRTTPLKAVLKQLRELPLRQIILVLHQAASPRLLRAARPFANVTIAYRPDLADADVGRALGAKLTTADSLLFVDGAKPVKADLLARFLRDCGTRLDVVLNDITSQLGLFHKRGMNYRLAEFLNRTMNRRDLHANSPATLPYALSRRVLNKIGNAALAVPPRAHASAILAGFRVGTAGHIRTSSRVCDTAGWNKAAAGHAEAWRAAIEGHGNRLLFPDKVRKRSLLGGMP